jgi:hypothetical protein
MTKGGRLTAWNSIVVQEKGNGKRRSFTLILFVPSMYLAIYNK